MPFLGTTINDDLNRVGWRFFRITDIPSQLGNPGWELILDNAPAGSEIAIGRNAVPGRWTFRANDNSYGASVGHVDVSSLVNDLQHPGRDAHKCFHTPEFRFQ